MAHNGCIIGAGVTKKGLPYMAFGLSATEKTDYSKVARVSGDGRDVRIQTLDGDDCFTAVRLPNDASYPAILSNGFWTDYIRENLRHHMENYPGSGVLDRDCMLSSVELALNTMGNCHNWGKEPVPYMAGIWHQYAGQMTKVLAIRTAGDYSSKDLDGMEDGNSFWLRERDGDSITEGKMEISMISMDIGGKSAGKIAENMLDYMQGSAVCSAAVTLEQAPKPTEGEYMFKLAVANKNNAKK